jgi:hypothetical protein
MSLCWTSAVVISQVEGRGGEHQRERGVSERARLCARLHVCMCDSRSRSGDGARQNGCDDRLPCDYNTGAALSPGGRFSGKLQGYLWHGQWCCSLSQGPNASLPGPPSLTLSLSPSHLSVLAISPSFVSTAISLSLSLSLSRYLAISLSRSILLNFIVYERGRPLRTCLYFSVPVWTRGKKEFTRI